MGKTSSIWCVFLRVCGARRDQHTGSVSRRHAAAASDRPPRQQRRASGALAARLPPRHRAGRRLHRVRHLRHEGPAIGLSARELARLGHRLWAGVRRPTETDALHPSARHQRHRPLQLRLHAARAPSVETPPAPVLPRPRVQRPLQHPHIRRVRCARQVGQQNRRHLPRTEGSGPGERPGRAAGRQHDSRGAGRGVSHQARLHAATPRVHGAVLQNPYSPSIYFPQRRSSHPADQVNGTDAAATTRLGWAGVRHRHRERPADDDRRRREHRGWDGSRGQGTLRRSRSARLHVPQRREVAVELPPRRERGVSLLHRSTAHRRAVRRLPGDALAFSRLPRATRREGRSRQRGRVVDAGRCCCLFGAVPVVPCYSVPVVSFYSVLRCQTMMLFLLFNTLSYFTVCLLLISNERLNRYITRLRCCLAE